MTQETQEIQQTVAAVLDTPNEVPAAPPQEPSPPAGGPPAPNAPKAAAKKRKAKKRVKRIIALVVTLAVLAGIGWAIWYFIFRDTVEQGEIMPGFAQLGSIQSKVEGSGNARAGKSAVINLTAPGTVRDVYISVGDTVSEGDPLYTIYSPTAEKEVDDAKKNVRAAEKAVESARESVISARDQVTEAREAVEEAQDALAEREDELQELQNGAGELSIAAPFAGKLISVEEIAVGSKLEAGAEIATLANDKVMKLGLYFSYAYINSIHVGQSADVSIPAMMLTCPGVVTAVNRISLVSPEGGILFEAVIDVANPGALTEELAATAVLSAADGSDIYPYDEGKLAYAETVKLQAKQAGPVTSKAMLKYADVAQGQVLLTQGSDDLDKLITAKEKEVKAARKSLETARKGVTAAEKGVTQAEQDVVDAQQDVLDAQDKVTDAEQALEDLNAVAPISGTITSCTINPGDEVKSGDTVITISDTSQMVVEILVDDRNIGFVTPGITVELTNWGDGMWMGTVTKIDLNPSQDNMGSGVTNYPVTLTVDNFDNTLTLNMPLQYSFVASQVEDCIIIPNPAVKSAVDEEGNELTVVFLKADSRPENAVAMPEQPPDMPRKYPTEEEGYYAVPVVTGLPDAYNVEIKSGLELGDEVFVNYLTASGSSWGW